MGLFTLQKQQRESHFFIQILPEERERERKREILSTREGENWPFMWIHLFEEGRQT
jgi:hypothetical protein